MELKELSVEYRKSAELLRQQLHDLREQLKAADSPEEQFAAKQRIKVLTPMLTDCCAIAELTEKYYERGYYRDERFSSNCFGDRQPCQEEAEANAAIDYYERTDGEATGYFHNVLYERIENSGNRKKTRNNQVDRKPYFETCEKKNLPNHTVSLNFSDELRDKFF